MKKCDQCHKAFPNTQIATCIWQEKKITLKLCPKCTKEYIDLTNRQKGVTMESLKQVGLLELGYTPKDIQEYLRKWNEKLYKSW